MKRAAFWTIAIVITISVLGLAVAPPLVRDQLLDGLRMPLDKQPRDFGMDAEAVSFPAADGAVDVRAWWIPARVPKAVVLMVHGGGSNRSFLHSRWLALAASLVQQGYSVLAPDLRNHGESDSAPDGEIGFGKPESSDLIGAVDYLSERVPGSRFGTLGCSMGGQTALYAAARDARIEAAITDSTYAVFEEIFPNWGTGSTGLPHFVIAPLFWSMIHLHGLPAEGGRGIDVIGGIAPRPVLENARC